MTSSFIEYNWLLQLQKHGYKHCHGCISRRHSQRIFNALVISGTINYAAVAAPSVRSFSVLLRFSVSNSKHSEYADQLVHDKLPVIILMDYMRFQSLLNGLHEVPKLGMM
ncbi:hypothetical protein Ddye_006805 [Dipteronia dyeriana]|uniref:Uncharacterized protein n=1 Tax=Dipteronia dyeriana TaxID=168575 RepID=A0AAD9XJB6_9ROSI|nr:hypothetical protein Ddye_006805 [Dipteronia dyeriana]